MTTIMKHHLQHSIIVTGLELVAESAYLGQNKCVSGNGSENIR